MNQHIVAIAFVTLAALGCSNQSPDVVPTTAKTTEHRDSLQAHGIHYQLPIEGDQTERAAIFLKAVTSRGISWSTGDLKLEVIDREIIFNGQPYGSVKHNGSIELTTDGQLTVDGEPRSQHSPPESPPPGS